MKNVLQKDRKAYEGHVTRQEHERNPQETDQGPVLVAIALLIFIVLIIGLLITSVWG